MHIDVKYLPQIPDEDTHQALFAAIDRATRWVYVEILPTQCAANAASFLERLPKAAPFKVAKVLTGNGKEFTDRFCATGQRAPTGNHLFDQVGTEHAIDHRLIKPRHPQTTGMVERFNGRIAEILGTTRFRSGEHLRDTLKRYVKLSNRHIPQRALQQSAPIAALKRWYRERPDLFH